MSDSRSNAEVTCQVELLVPGSFVVLTPLAANRPTTVWPKMVKINCMHHRFLQTMHMVRSIVCLMSTNKHCIPSLPEVK